MLYGRAFFISIAFKRTKYLPIYTSVNMPTPDLNKRSALKSVMFWSLISAAFIGPGTVATASAAGARFGVALIWAVLFSTIATLVLQEAAARITITTGQNLGEHIRMRFAPGMFFPFLIWCGIAFGCAAYESGNILGAVSGLGLMIPGNTRIYTVLVFLIALMLLRRGDIRFIARSLGILVALMGFAFIAVATQTSFSMGQILQGALVPSVSQSSVFLIIGLVGTTIVPYNLFLGSRLGKGQDLRQMRFGLTIAVLFGGLITACILMVGTLVQGEFQFSTLSAALAGRLGPWGGYLFGLGLFAAGLTSSVTAPLAAAITAQSVMPRWHPGSIQFRLVWIAVLVIGLVMGLLNFKPIPVIIAAQVINGMLLPVIAVLLFVIGFPPHRYHHKINTIPLWHLTLAVIVLAVVLFLGLQSLLSAIEKTGLWDLSDQVQSGVSVFGSAMFTVLALWVRHTGR